MKFKKNEIILICIVVAIMAVYFLVSHPVLMDDGLQYEGFAQALAHGQLAFGRFYGFQGLSIIASVVYLLTRSHISVVITSVILSLLSIPLAYLIGRECYKSERAGFYFLALFLLMPYPYVTMMRGFQEAALLFFVLAVIYGSLREETWTPLVWAFGAIVKPFTLILFPLFLKNFLNQRRFYWLAGGLTIGLVYLMASYFKTGHLVNDAAINSYASGAYVNGNPPALSSSFTFGFTGFARVFANLLVYPRKIILSPITVISGIFGLVLSKEVKFRTQMLAAVVINVLLVSVLTFSFPKYLLPAIVILALASIYLLERFRWMIWLILADSLAVFLPIWNYFGSHFWNNVWIFLLPWYLAAVIMVYYGYIHQSADHHSHA